MVLQCMSQGAFGPGDPRGSVDISRMIAALRAERSRLDEAIASLEKLSLASAPRRGRPPLSSRVANVAVPQNGHNGSTHRAVLPPRHDRTMLGGHSAKTESRQAEIADQTGMEAKLSRT